MVPEQAVYGGSFAHTAFRARTWPVYITVYSPRLMRAVDIIVRKRDGAALTRAEIEFVVSGVTSGALPEYQISALLMAMLLRGMSDEETACLTEAMVGSGQRVDLSRIPGRKAGKHSTGGVGDKTSIVVVPLVAACGVVVPKSSGRGLGHTGGTIDKLESIPGFRVAMDREAFLSSLERIGCVFVGQTADIAPADKKLYALRDVTGTVESIPLIASSIMSKKIAEGTDVLVLDVKVGRGAFMKSEAEARRLSETMVAIGARVGLTTEALLTAMDAPLGRAVGNALEIGECLDTLAGRGPSDLEEVSLSLGTRMLRLAGGAADDEEAKRRLRRALASGAALEKFRQVLGNQGGDVRIVEDRGRLPHVAQVETMAAARAGVVSRIDAALAGRASMALGAGRERLGAPIDPGAGLVLRVKPGDRVEAGDALVDLHPGAHARLEEARALVSEAIAVSDEAPRPMPLVLGVVV
jgi:pyrimidine-nucleoside phosphorylase